MYWPAVAALSLALSGQWKLMLSSVGVTYLNLNQFVQNEENPNMFHKCAPSVVGISNVVVIMMVCCVV